MIVDTHAHLTSDAFKDDLDSVLMDARGKGVSTIICVTEDLEECRYAMELKRRFPIIRVGAGLFPTVLHEEKAQNIIDYIAQHPEELACIGEVGLDFWKVKDEAKRGLQEEIFKGFIRISRATGLPLNCHSRSAGRRTIEILLAQDAQKVQLHAFDARHGTALQGEEAGFFFSIPPSVVRSRQKQKLVRALSLDSLLVESDAPVLGPEPTTRNVPGNVLVALRAISEIKDEPLEKAREIIWENYKKLYGKQP